MRPNKRIFALALSLIFISFLRANQSDATFLIIKLRFYEGLRSIVHRPSVAVTSSYLSPLLTANILTAVDQAEESKQICRVFNLIDVRLLAEADLEWDILGKTKSHVLQFDSHEISIAITPVKNRLMAGSESAHQLCITVAEQAGAENVTLLDTEIIIPGKNAVVLGFESSDGFPYFPSLNLLSSAEAKKIFRELSMMTERKARISGIFGGAITAEKTEAVAAGGEIKPPRLIRRVDPIYPEEAKKAAVQGIVILEAETDDEGNAVRTKVLHSIPYLTRRPLTLSVGGNMNRCS
ncbi:MAG: hypothetical protein ACUVR0_09095 [Candidatus Aminicenantales bacterium]